MATVMLGNRMWMLEVVLRKDVVRVLSCLQTSSYFFSISENDICKELKSATMYTLMCVYEYYEKREKKHKL